MYVYMNYVRVCVIPRFYVRSALRLKKQLNIKNVIQHSTSCKCMAAVGWMKITLGIL